MAGTFVHSIPLDVSPQDVAEVGDVKTPQAQVRSEELVGWLDWIGQGKLENIYLEEHSNVIPLDPNTIQSRRNQRFALEYKEKGH